MRNGKLESEKEFDDGLTPIENAQEGLSKLAELAPIPAPVISGLLRKGNKMLLAGPSKSGKSMLLMEMALAIAAGRSWLGFNCTQGKVLYINMDAAAPSLQKRLQDICDAQGWGTEKTTADNLTVWNLRGTELSIAELVSMLTNYAKGQGYTAVIIDPLHKIMTGKKSPEQKMSALCNQFDLLETELGCAFISSYNHSDKKSFSFVDVEEIADPVRLAADCDTVLNVTELKTDATWRPQEAGWRLEAIPRDRPPLAPVDIWFRYPLHVVDTTGELARRARKMQERVLVVAAAEKCIDNGDAPTVQKVAGITGLDKGVVRRRGWRSDIQD